MNSELHDYVLITQCARQIFAGSYLVDRPAGDRKQTLRQKEPESSDF